jgi:hypothetical protein
MITPTRFSCPNLLEKSENSVKAKFSIAAPRLPRTAGEGMPISSGIMCAVFAYTRGRTAEGRSGRGLGSSGRGKAKGRSPKAPPEVLE